MSERQVFNLTMADIDMQKIGNDYHAMWVYTINRQFIGCPLGVGITKFAAMNELVRRTERESNVTIYIG